VTDRRQVVTVDDFFSGAAEMRRTFDERLGNRRDVVPERFVWDFWHVPDQYTYIRTFADQFFPSDLFGAFLERLLAWGRETLGCAKVVPPWLSYYLDGCRQELHADIPHGQWAYVFSLTNWDDRGFAGGETMLLSEATLDFWHSYDPSRFSELGSFVDLIEPRFNRLTVFDPRIPHGVRPIEGTREPLDSRIAVHGWFHEPTITVGGGLEEADPRRALDATLALLLLTLRGVEEASGLVTARIDVSADGEVANVRIVSSSLISTGHDSAAEVERSIIESLAAARMPRLTRDGWAVIPLALPVGGNATQAN